MMERASCRCDLIACVREDERQKTFDADWSEMGQLAAVRLFRGQAYAAALRDAVEAVLLSPSADIELVERSQVIDAIEALGGER